MNEQEFKAFCLEIFTRPGAEKEDYPQLPPEKIAEIGDMLLDLDITADTKESAILLLAHQQTKPAIKALRRYIRKTTDPHLKIFAEIGLDECIWWNEP